MTDEQPPLDSNAAPDPNAAQTLDTPPVEGSGWVQPTPAAAPPPPVEGSGWVQPTPAAPAAAAGPAWGQPTPAAPPPPPVEGSGWVQPPPAAPAAAAGPAWGQPPAQAPAPAPATGWAQPQAAAPGWIQPTQAKGPVTILARIAGLFLVVLGLFWGAIGALLIVGGTAFHMITDQFGALNTTDANTVDAAGNVVGGVIAGFGIVILVLAIVEVIGGLGALFGKTWGRVIGILYSLVFGAFLLIGISGGTRAADLANDSSANGGVIFLIVMFILYLYSLVVLLLRWRGSAHA